MKPGNFLILLFSLMVFSACARVTITPVDLDGDQTGIRYYEPYPYLLVSSQVAKDGTTNTEAKQFQIIYLPDLSKQRSIRMHAGWGSVEMEPNLENGWMLTGMSGKADSKVAENITAVAALATAGGALFMKKDPAKGLEDGFYPLIFKEGKLVGFGTQIKFEK